MLTRKENANCPCPTQWVTVQVGLWYINGTASCRLLVLPQEDLSVLTHSTLVHRCPSTGLLGRRDHASTIAEDFVCAYVGVV